MFVLSSHSHKEQISFTCPPERFSLSYWEFCQIPFWNCLIWAAGFSFLQWRIPLKDSESHVWVNSTELCCIWSPYRQRLYTFVPWDPFVSVLMRNADASLAVPVYTLVILFRNWRNSGFIGWLGKHLFHVSFRERNFLKCLIDIGRGTFQPGGIPVRKFWSMNSVPLIVAVVLTYLSHLNQGFQGLWPCPQNYPHIPFIPWESDTLKAISHLPLFFARVRWMVLNCFCCFFQMMRFWR